MANIVDPGVEAYLQSLQRPGDPVLEEMEQLARRTDFPIVGPQVGNLLGILARSTGARRILELGSGFGYSAYWMAHAAGRDVRIICTDLSAENRDRALGFLGRGGVADRVDFRVGDALEIASTLEGPFDLIFCDVDKHAYPRSVELALPLLRSGGLFITDNALWSGKVADGQVVDATTLAVREFNRIVTTHPSLQTVILPIRDGLAVCAKAA